MKITETFHQPPHSGYFQNDSIVICSSSLRVIANTDIYNVRSIKMTLATVNPKKKGFRKVYYGGQDGYRQLYVGNWGFTLMSCHVTLFKQLKIEKYQPFWLKAEVL